jgi:uncharacterized protein with FMN-binding domain
MKLEQQLISGTLPSIICSEISQGLFLIAVMLGSGFLQEAVPQVLMTKDAALARFFPGLTVERRTLFLDEEQEAVVKTRARTEVESRIVTYYVARSQTKVEGYAFLETNTVRTMPETFIVVIRPDSTVSGVEILAFHEPADYLPGARWLSTFVGHRLTDGLWVKRDIPNITGATLSSQAITRGVRKAIVLFELVTEKEARP